MIENLHALICHGRDGKERTFWYEFKYNESFPQSRISFCVHKSNPPKMLEENWFEMTIERCPDGLWKIIFIGDAARRLHYAVVGIPDALIPEAGRVLQAPLRSSSNIGMAGTNEFRTIDAEKMWKRLQAKGLARYEQTEDYYICDRAIAGQDR
jgi:hypothetical protein